MKVIPAIDIKDGCCVRLLKGDFNRETKYDSDPIAVARRFNTFGCDVLHLVDLDGALTGQRANRKIASRIVSESIFDVQLGGGIRSAESIQALLDVGITRCVIGSIAVTDPKAVSGWLKRFDPDSIVLALDVRLDTSGIPQLSTHGWTKNSKTSLWSAVDTYVDVGVHHILCTDIDRDGAMKGPNVDLYRKFVDRYPDIRLQASGGIRDVDDLVGLRETGAAAAITGRALLDGCITAREISSFLLGA